MTLADKIVTLRKQLNLSQEELAERLNVSRQAVSRWEVGSALPDASNVLQLSRTFGVTADFLLNDDYESDRDLPAVKNSERMANGRIKRIVCLCIAAFGLFGNFIFYLLSRFIEVQIPHITYENGEKWYTFSSGITGYSYKYFLQEHNLEFLTILFWILVLAGLAAAFVPGETWKKLAGKLWKSGKKPKASG